MRAWAWVWAWVWAWDGGGESEVRSAVGRWRGCRSGREGEGELRAAAKPGTKPCPPALDFNPPCYGLPASAVQVQDACLYGELTVEAGPVVDGLDAARGVASYDAIAILDRAATRGAANLGQPEGRWARRGAGGR